MDLNIMSTIGSAASSIASSVTGLFTQKRAMKVEPAMRSKAMNYEKRAEREIDDG